MRHLSFILIPLFASSCILAQSKPELYAKNDVSIVKILAEQFEDGRATAEVVTTDTLDYYGRVRGSASFNGSTMLNRHSTSVSADSLTEDSRTYDGKNVLLYRYIHQKNPKRNMTYTWQIQPTGDTVTWQERFHDRNGNDSILYTRSKTGKLYVSARWKYDKDGKEIRQDFIAEDGKIWSSGGAERDVKTGNCIFHYDDRKVKKSKTCRTENIETETFYTSGRGYRNGITIERSPGGKGITIYNEKGLATTETYYDGKGEMTARYTYTYTYR